MSFMTMINLQIEIFLLILVGYVCTRLGMISLETRKQLTSLVLGVFLPASIIQSFQLDMTIDILYSCLAVFLAASGIQVLYFVLMKLSWRWVSNENERINLEYGTMVSNAGFMGMPVSSAAFGPQGLLYASIFLIPQRICMWSTGLALYTDAFTWKQRLIKVATHPCIVALAIGVGVMLAGLAGVQLPEWLSLTLKACGSCSTALSMMVIGSVLADVPFRQLKDPICLLYSLLRLLIIPGLVWGMGLALGWNTLGLRVCVLLCAMPAPSTMVMLAQSYGRHPAFASRVVFVSTFLSLFLLPFWLHLLQG